MKKLCDFGLFECGMTFYQNCIKCLQIHITNILKQDIKISVYQKLYRRFTDPHLSDRKQVRFPNLGKMNKLTSNRLTNAVYAQNRPVLENLVNIFFNSFVSICIFLIATNFKDGDILNGMRKLSKLNCSSSIYRVF